MWRAKKDGSEPVQAVSGMALNEVGVATCNFSRSQLTAAGLFTCRNGRIFRMNRAGDGQAKVIYSAPAASAINGLAVDGSYAYVNGPYSQERHLAPLLEVSLASGEASEVGQMIECLVPDAVFPVGQNLVFSSLSRHQRTPPVISGPDLATTSEWAKRQRSYRIGPGESTPTKISAEDIVQVRGADADATDVYTATGDHTIVRISVDGTTRTFVDCTDYQGPEGEMLIYDLWVDADGVYVRDTRNDGQYWRFAK